MLMIYKYFNLLNLDVVSGAVISSMAFAELLEVQVETPVYFLLGLAVWVIYTFDRLMDTRDNEKSLKSERHFFHKKYFIPLGWSVVLCLLLSTLLLLVIHPKTLLWGTMVSGSVLIYLSMVHLLNVKWMVIKEVVIAVIYTIGVLLGPLSVFEGVFDSYFTFSALVFFLVVLSNLFIFSLYDVEFDHQAGLPSVVTVLGTEPVKKLVRMISFLMIGVTVTGFIISGNPLFVILFFMALPLIFLFKFHDTKFCQANYRYIGDAVFLLPVIFL